MSNMAMPLRREREIIKPSLKMKGVSGMREESMSCFRFSYLNTFLKSLNGNKIADEQLGSVRRNILKERGDRKIR